MQTSTAAAAGSRATSMSRADAENTGGDEAEHLGLEAVGTGTNVGRGGDIVDDTVAGQRVGYTGGQLEKCSCSPWANKA